MTAEDGEPGLPRGAEQAYRAAVIVAAIQHYRRHQDALRALERAAPGTEPALSAREWKRPSPQDPVDSAMKDPIRAALKSVVRDQGWRAYAAGGRAAMDALFAEVERALPGHGALLDKWWNEIGGRDGIWVA